MLRVLATCGTCATVFNVFCAAPNGNTYEPICPTVPDTGATLLAPSVIAPPTSTRRLPALGKPAIWVKAPAPLISSPVPPTSIGPTTPLLPPVCGFFRLVKKRSYAVSVFVWSGTNCSDCSVSGTNLIVMFLLHR